MKYNIKTSNLDLSVLGSTTEPLQADWSGRTSFQVIGTATGRVNLKASNNGINYFILLNNQLVENLLIDTSDYKYYVIEVHTAGSGVVNYEVCGSDVVLSSNSGGGGVSTGVTSFNTRTGSVTSTINDYNASQIENTPAGDVTATNVQGAINELDSKIDANTGLITARSEFLIATQSTTSNSPVLLGSNTFVIPAGKKAHIRSIIVFTSAATTTGMNHSLRVSNPSGANANVIGRTYSGVNISSTASATALNDGDIYDVSPNTNLIRSIVGTASTAGNNASIRFADIYNQSTTTDAVVTIEFASEVNASAVTAQVGSGATCIIF